MRLRGEKFEDKFSPGGGGGGRSSFSPLVSSFSFGGGGGGRLTRQCPSISESAPWRSARVLRGSGPGGGDHWSTPGAGTLTSRLRSLSLSGGGGGGGGGGSFPLAPAASPEPRRRPRGASLSLFPVDDPAGSRGVDDLDAEVEDVDDGASSLRSFGSACSAMSCDHAYFARNGTTFSGRRMKYVVHCSPHAGETDDYLTPTQRAARQIRRLKGLLQQAQKEMNQKDQDIFRLTKEVVELRLFKASLNADPNADCADGAVGGKGGGGGGEGETGVAGALASPEPDDVTAAHSPRTLLLHNDQGSQGGEKTSSPSLADSGHFEDIATTPEPPSAQGAPAAAPSPRRRPREVELEAEVVALEQRLEEARAAQARDSHEQKERHNDRVEALLQRLSDANNQYCELRSEYDRAQDKIRQLERETESLRKNMEEHEERHKSMYLKMYMKGQEAARFEHADQVLEFAHKAPSRVSVPELLQQLQVAESELENMKETDDLQHTLAPKSALLSAKEALSLWLLGTRKAMYRRIVESRAKKGELDPEITLQFLKSAIYYFLTDKENQHGHLNAIESILGYNENEKVNIEKACRMYARK